MPHRITKIEMGIRRFGALLFAIALTLAIADGSRAQSETPTPSSSPAVSAPLPAGSASQASQAFADGYRAYLAHDLPRAQEQLQSASANSAIVGDYALYYLGLVQRDLADYSAAAAILSRVASEYPQSVMAQPAELEMARAELQLGRNADASVIAARLVARSSDPAIEQGARMVEAKAVIALGDTRAAYNRLMTLRELNPLGATDSEARILAYSTLAANPQIADRNSLEYRKSEAELLMREGEPALALALARQALAIAPPPAVRAELLWIEARALRSEPSEQKQAISAYLKAAPNGPLAAEALETLALIYWREENYASATSAFNRLVNAFPQSVLAPGAMLRIGRIYEDQHKYDSARAAYRRLLARYPSSEAADEARFRAPWMYYMTRRYVSAAKGFETGRAQAKTATDRDMFAYWRARALEKSGDREAARAIYAAVASSIESNYYPALASRRVDAIRPELPAASLPDPTYGQPPALAGAPRFHLDRAIEFRALGLKELEAPELKMLEPDAASNSRIRDFLFAAFADADAWHEAIEAAARMEKRREIGPEMAERLRYPRAYWDTIAPLSRKSGLDPYLVIALTRQESLFDPQVTSISDARGLMQLLPSTARRTANQQGMPSESLNLYDASLNLRLGTAYLRSLMQLFDGNEFRAVAAYNGGEHAVAHWITLFPMEDDEWVENIGYRETREYVKKVIGGRREYILLYGRRSAPS